MFYRIDGKQVRDIIGRHQGKDLADARQIAKDKLALVERGRDPRTEEARHKAQQARQRAETFRRIADDYKAGHLAKLRSGGELWAAIEADFLPDWRDLPIRDLTRGMVKAKLDEIEVARGLYSRNRRLALVRNLLNFALEGEWVDANVVARIKMLEETERDRILTDAELVEVWHAAGRLLAPGNAMVRQMILSGQRRNEVSEMAWPEIAEAEALWTVPAARMKSKLAHEVPLDPGNAGDDSGRADGQRPENLRLRQPSPEGRSDRRLQPTEGRPRQVHSGGTAEVDPNAKPMTPWRLHDLRRTMRSGLSRLRVSGGDCRARYWPCARWHPPSL